MRKGKLVVKVKNIVLRTAYHLAENIDGERKLRLISYRNGEKIKRFVRENYEG